MRAAQSNRSVRIHPGSIPLSVKPFFALAIAAAAFCLISIHAAEPAPPAMSAAELADRLNAVSQGNALIRTKLEVRSLERRQARPATSDQAAPDEDGNRSCLSSALA